ncbi:MAG: hypothetical protein M1409_04245 [Actinobacteria bacterium]|nr:hypothetical protein [Actinomycetota bacterium]
MRKLLLIGGMLIFLGLFASKGYAGQSGGNGTSTKSKIVGSLKKAMKIKRDMRKIRIETIKSDPQLKQTFQQIRTLAKQLHKILSAKLKGNSKYQDLKQQLKTIRKELQKERKSMK